MHQGKEEEEEPIDEQFLSELPLELKTYLSKVKETIKASDAARRSEVRTVDDTATSLSTYKQNLPWDLKETIPASDAFPRSEVYTVDHTLTAFASKQDRLWALKENDELTDAIFITSDGHREVSDTGETFPSIVQSHSL